MSKKYSLSDLFRDVWTSSPDGTTKHQCEAIVKSVMENIALQVRLGNTVEIREFATFKPVDRPARTGRNPATGEPVQIPARKACAIKAKFKMTAGE